MPRAERIDGRWTITLRMGVFEVNEETAAQANHPWGCSGPFIQSLIESAKLREALQGSEESGLACERKLAREQSEHRDTQAEVTRLAAYMSCFDRTPEVIAYAIGLISERKDALEQIANLGAFIGHPGATPAHVVSETVSLIDTLRGRLRTIGQITGPPGLRDNEIVDAVGFTVEAAHHADKEASEWRQSSETWQKRAMAAEARVEEEMERGKSWCSESITQRKRAEAAEARLAVEADAVAPVSAREAMEMARELLEKEVSAPIGDSERELITVRPGCGFSGRNRSMVFRIREDGSVEIER